MVKQKRRRIRVWPFVLTGLVIAGLFIGVCFLLNHSNQTLYEARYPTEYEEFVIKYAKAYNVSPELIFGIIKTESNFDENATSHRDAYGLMQITEETFWWAQSKMGTKEGVDFYDPETNIQYGTFIFSLFYEEFGSEREALCAYNAGRGNVNDWLDDPSYSGDGKRIDFIPFEETRNYVDKVLTSRDAYKQLYGERFEALMAQ